MATSNAHCQELSVTDGNDQVLRTEGRGALVVAELGGRYAEDTLRGHTFAVANASVATTTVGLATTYTGLCISNPIGSNINMVVLKATMMESIANTTQVEGYAIAIGYNGTTNVTHTAAVTPVSRLVGSGLVAIGKADSQATLPTAPTYDTFVTNTAGSATNSAGVQFDYEGSLILIPGAYACWVTPTQVSVAGLWFSFAWIERPTNLL